MATINQEIADFTLFARALAEQQGEAVTLDQAYQTWRDIEPREVALLKERYDAYLAEGPGEPAGGAMAKLRERLGLCAHV